MDKAESDFMALKELHQRIKEDPSNAGWYMHCAYKLGCGCSVDEALELPPKEAVAHGLTVIKGGKA